MINWIEMTAEQRAARDAETDKRYFSSTRTEPGGVGVKFMGNLRVLVEDRDGSWHVQYIDRADAERLRDKLNEWYPRA